MQVVQTGLAPQPLGHYSQALVYGGLVFVSGQLPLDPVTGEVAGASIEEQMERDRERFDITELNWTRDGTESKYDRIQRLEPWFRSGRFMLPAVVKAETSAQKKVREAGQAFRIYEPTRRRDESGNAYSLSKTLLDEYLVYPFSSHDDFLDACSRIEDMDAQPPVIVDERATMPELFADGV